MQTILNHNITTNYNDVSTGNSLWSRFMNYCEGQEKNRLFWVGVIMVVHGCVITPVTVMITLMAGPHFALFMTAMVAMGIALVTNLAAMPTRVTIPAFVLSIIMDIAVIISCVVMAAS